jgi:cellobiose phosphorylase
MSDSPLATFGYFSEDGLEFHVTRPDTPRPWRNFLWNDTFVSHISQVGQGGGFKQTPEGVRTSLITSRAIYLLSTDTRRFWTVHGLPVHLPYDLYHCVHGIGFTRIEVSYGDIRSSCRVFVPREGDLEIWTVTLTNVGAHPQALRLVPSFDTAIDGWYKGATRGWYDPKLRAALASNVVRTGSHYAHDSDGRRDQGFLTLSVEPSGYDTRRTAFIGHYDTERAPEALLRGGCTNSDCEFEKVTLAMQSALTLPPGGEATLHALAGVWESQEQIAALRERYFTGDGVEREFQASVEAYRAAASGLCIETPDAPLDRFANGWLQHQLNLNATWARVYFNGYRDLCQDATNLMPLAPVRARAKLKQTLSYQYPSGHAPRAWIGGGVVEQDYSDSAVWIVPAVYAAAMEAGTLDFLGERVPFHKDSRPVDIYEHARRSLNYLWSDRGPHGLSRIHKGDWNDLMNGVGAGGKGESVWLSMALFYSLKQFAELADWAGRPTDAGEALDRSAELAHLVDQWAWDGEFYLRAFTDDGVRVGSRGSREGMFLNPQSWSVISGIAKGDHGLRAMRSVDERLDCDIGILTLERPFDGEFRPEIGFLSAVRPGENVNGGVYLHANAFKVVADCLLKRNDQAWWTLEKMLPFSRWRRVAYGEPFVLPNGYCGPHSGYQAGRAPSSWVTGTAGWLVTALAAHIFGLKPTRAGLRVDPCLPVHWHTARIVRRFRGAIYDVRFVQTDRPPCNHVVRITLDGEVLPSDVLPPLPPGTHQAVVELI